MAPPRHEHNRYSNWQEWMVYLVGCPLAAILTVLAWQYADLLRHETLLYRAATAAANEAALPRATQKSIAAAAQRVLCESRLANVADAPIVTINGKSILISPLDLLESGDQIRVTTSAYVIDVVPDVLRGLGISMSGRKLRATASCTKP